MKRGTAAILTLEGGIAALWLLDAINLASLLAVLLFGLVAVPLSYADELTFECALVFPGDPATVFTWVQTPANWEQLPNVVSTTGTGKPGTTTRVHWRTPHRDHFDDSVLDYEVIAYEFPHRVVNLNRTDDGVATEELLFEPHPDGTLVRSRYRMRLAHAASWRRRRCVRRWEHNGVQNLEELARLLGETLA